MKKMFRLSCCLAALASFVTAGGAAVAQTIVVKPMEGTEIEVAYRNGTLKRWDVVLDSGDRLAYEEIESISTDYFDAYDRAVRQASKSGNEHLSVIFTGDENVHALELQELERRRDGAGVARGIGGMLMLLGALSGDSDVRALGLATYGAGTIAQDVNTSNSLAAQRRAIEELQLEQKTQSDELTLEQEYRLDFGNENVDSLIALVDRNYPRALALANAGETSDDANYRLAAVWMKALIFVDQGNNDAARSEYERLIVLDPEVESIDDAEMWMDDLLVELAELREG